MAAIDESSIHAKCTKEWPDDFKMRAFCVERQKAAIENEALKEKAEAMWAARLAEFDIPVYEIQPGVIRSDMTAGVTEKYDRLIAEGLTLEPRWGEPEEVAKAVAALVRGEIPYATGQVLKIDGGMTVRRL